jgi:RNA polymerase sigma-70 factor, ECF subfamily
MDDHDLIRAAQAGDEDAWQLLYKRYQRRIYSFACRLGAESAEDICQRVWEALARHLWQYECRDGAPFWTWLSVVIRHIHIRAVQREQRIQIVYDVPPIEHEDVEQTAIGRVFAMQLLARLPDAKDRTVLTLRVWQDLTFEEIAVRLGVSEAAVRLYYERGLQDLRNILNGIVPPPKHIRHAPSLTVERQAEARRRYAAGEASVKQLAEQYGVSPITMGAYVRGLKTITCDRCGAADVRPAKPNSFTCGPCLKTLQSAGERWCSYGKHAVPDGPPSAHGACAVCEKIRYQLRKAAANVC